MRKLIYTIATALTLVSCVDLNMNPLSSASSENWYSDAEEIRMALNDLYRSDFYGLESEYWTDRRTDDWNQRDYCYEMTNGSTTSATTTFKTYWNNTYKAISRAIRVIESIEQKHNDATEYETLKAEAYFFRAYFYARLVVCWGDVPFYTGSISVQEALEMGRTDKNIIKEQIYKDYDAAIEALPADNGDNGVFRVNKAVALAMKARYALTIKDYQECENLCTEIMAMNRYSLAADYGELFRDRTMGTEVIWSIAHSNELETDSNGNINTQNVKSWVLRTAGGNATAQPSWDLLAAYECTDGKAIDESPLFDPSDPYKNRDPRCCETFAAPGTVVFGVVFDPSPETLNVYDETLGKTVKNKDTKANDNYAPYNGCCIRKGVQTEWRTLLRNDNPQILVRYADILLMYAEAKIEQNEIDYTVLDAINAVRARAYGVSPDETTLYPAISGNDQAALRKVLRRERRVEFAWEGRRWFDLQRWGLLEKCYSHHMYGLPNATGLKKNFAEGIWFWGETPQIDEDGFADFSPMEAKGWIVKYGHHTYNPKVELFPIPDSEITANKNLVQNPGY